MSNQFTIFGAPPFIQALMDARDIPQVVAAVAARIPDRPCMILERDGREPLVVSFSRLMARAHAYAAAYRARKLVVGSVVVLMLVTHQDLTAAFLGTMMAGLVPTILPPRTSKADMALFYAAQAEMFVKIDAALIVTEGSYVEELNANMPAFSPLIQRMEDVADATPSDISTRAPDGIAFLQHSSGTTGTKKGVVLTHRAVLDFVAALATALRANEDDIIASWLPLYHDMGLIGCLILPMVLGLTVVQMDPFDWVTRPVVLLESIQRNRATLCWMPNFAFHHIIRTVPQVDGFDLSSMRAFIDCSEPCKPGTLRLFAAHFSGAGLGATALQVSYGMAENVFIATQTDMLAPPMTVIADVEAYSVDGEIRLPAGTAKSLEFISVGSAIPGTQLRIVDGSGTELPDRRVGQIAIRSSYMFSGYFQRPMQAGVLSNGWYMSGDLGFSVDGSLFVCGRIDDLLIVNGRNIYAHDVEYAVNQGTEVKPGRCVAIAPFNQRMGSKSLILIAETTKESSQERRALIGRIRAVVQAIFGVAIYEVRLTPPGWMVKTSSGKVSREGNEAKFLSTNPMS